MAGATNILGIEIPSTAPAFLVLVGIHIALGVASVVSGIGAMLSQKGSRRHIRFGKIYYGCLATIFATALILGITRWEQDWHLVVLGTLAFASATLGRQAMKRRWPVRLHISGMGASYVLMLTAFYVDNGKSLPLWRDLPTPAFWIGPTFVGLPVIVWAINRYANFKRQL